MLSNGVYTVGNNTLGSRRPLRDLDAKTGSSSSRRFVAGENAIKRENLCCEAKANPLLSLLSKEILKMASKTRLSLTLVVLIKNLRLPFPLVVNPERIYKGT